MTSLGEGSTSTPPPLFHGPTDLPRPVADRQGGGGRVFERLGVAPAVALLLVLLGDDCVQPIADPGMLEQLARLAAVVGLEQLEVEKRRIHDEPAVGRVA